MVKRSPLFLGLIRPARIMGLPMFYAVIWMVGSVLAFVWVQSFWTHTFTALSYPALWIAAEWDPHFFDVVTVVRLGSFSDMKRRHWASPCA